jgi:hypothetical protein
MSRRQNKNKHFPDLLKTVLHLLCIPLPLLEYLPHRLTQHDGVDFHPQYSNIIIGWGHVDKMTS